jgi:hypothetical protein
MKSQIKSLLPEFEGDLIHPCVDLFLGLPRLLLDVKFCLLGHHPPFRLVLRAPLI